MLKFCVIWTGQAFSLFSSARVQFALAWWLTKGTALAMVLATATLVVLLPQMVAGPCLGALADRLHLLRVSGIVLFALPDVLLDHVSVRLG